MPTTPFETLGASPLQALRDVRIELHWAAQIVAAVGHTSIAKKPDDSHASLLWEPTHGALASLPLEGPRAVRAALRFHDFRLLVLVDDAVSRSTALEGKSIDDLLAWLGQALAHEAGRDLAPLERPRHEMPPHPVQSGDRFGAPTRTVLEEWDAWYAGAYEVLSERRAREPRASEVRCWPHHFDIATLVSLSPPADDAVARSIGVGMSPGDGSYDEPYFYVTPWPYPNKAELPNLATGGRWHTEGWVGAVLPATSIVAVAGPERRARVNAFLDSAYGSALAMLLTACSASTAPPSLGTNSPTGSSNSSSSSTAATDSTTGSASTGSSNGSSGSSDGATSSASTSTSASASASASASTSTSASTSASGSASSSNASGSGGVSTTGIVIHVDASRPCGNGNLDFGEQCDDGNAIDGDGCSSICRLETPPCPTGPPCVLAPLCGDGKLASSELCDDGNIKGGDGCAADCKAVEPGWRCPVPGRSCTPICGDGIVVGPETCDDGNALDGDGCSHICLREPDPNCEAGVCPPECGNAIVRGDEECDLGPANNDTTYEGCTTTCKLGPFCGDGAINGPEACDLGRNNVTTYGTLGGCTPACTASHYCGDGIVDGAYDEQCDTGLGNGTGACTKRCLLIIP